MPRGDIIPIDSRSHLEVADRKHRYAKNLRLYFKEFHRLEGVQGVQGVQGVDTGVQGVQGVGVQGVGVQGVGVGVGESAVAHTAHTAHTGTAHTAHTAHTAVQAASSSSKWRQYDSFFKWLDESEKLPEVRRMSYVVRRMSYVIRCSAVACRPRTFIHCLQPRI
jgi:hypothetical protein